MKKTPRTANIEVVLNPGGTIATWINLLIENLGEMGDANVTLTRRPLAQTKGPSVGFRFYSKFDHWYFEKRDDGRPNAFEHKYFATNPKPEGREKPDIVLDLSDRNIDLTDSDSVLPFGAWRVVFDGFDPAPGTGALFGAVARNARTVSASLIYTPSSGGTSDRKPLYDGVYAVDPLSLYRTQNRILWTLAAHIPIAVHRFLKTDPEIRHNQSLEGKSSREAALSQTRRPCLLTTIFKLVTRWVRTRWTSLRKQDIWSVAIRTRTNDCTLIDSSSGQCGGGFSRVKHPNGLPMADPFLFEMDQDTYLFYEEISDDDGKGRISVGLLDDGGSLSQISTAIEEPYHLSYPMLLHWQDELFMFVESQGNLSVNLYRCAQFPDKWVLDAELLQGLKLADPTPYIDAQNPDRLWLFAAMSVKGGSSNDSLYLFHADQPRGPWVQHPLNPLVVDVRNARPGGAIIQTQDALYRASQDCSVGYGYALNFCQIDTLTEDSYKEHAVKTITPSLFPAYKGIHTYSKSRQFECVDRKKAVSRS